MRYLYRFMHRGDALRGYTDIPFYALGTRQYEKNLWRSGFAPRKYNANFKSLLLLNNFYILRKKLQVAEEICVDLPPQMAALCNVVYFPQLGYLVTVPCLTQYANIIARLPGFDLQVCDAFYIWHSNYWLLLVQNGRESLLQERSH